VSQPTATLIAGIVTAMGSTAVGISAIAFAWHNMKATLRQERTMAAEGRIWEQRRAVYQELAEWLAGHHLAGSDDPLSDPADYLSSHTEDPGQELEAKVRLFGNDQVAAGVSHLREKAYAEDKILRAFKTAMAYPGSFEESSDSEKWHWKHPNDAQQLLNTKRQDWAASRQHLETTLREVYQPTQDRAPSRPAWRGLMSPP
jgi:hypothetical protein